MIINIQNATKTIKKATVLDNVTCTFQSNMIYGLQGPNGSGKTMLLRLLAGLIRPSHGHITIDGKLLGIDMDFPPSLGLIIEEPAFLPNYTGLRNLELLAAIKRKASTTHIRQAIIDVGLDPDDTRKVRKYSLGMKKRLAVAAAIMEEPDLILLDEPTNALDDNGVAQICRIITRERNRGALVVIACHDMSILNSVADEIYTVNEGIVEKKVQ